jgi:hypothetical protein
MSARRCCCCAATVGRRSRNRRLAAFHRALAATLAWRRRAFGRPARQLGLRAVPTDTPAMGIRTRGLDIGIKAKRQVADRAVRAEAKAVIDPAGRDMLWSPTIRAARIAGVPWLDVHCPGCGRSRAIDLRTVDRHPLASVGTLVLGLRCSWCLGSAPMPRSSDCTRCRRRRRQPRRRFEARGACGSTGFRRCGGRASRT